MAKQRDFLQAVGREFETFTGGTSTLESEDPESPLGGLHLRCELNHEVLRIESSAFAAESPVTASSIAVQVAFLFDRSRAASDAAMTELPPRTLADLQQLALDRVRQYGFDVIASQKTLPERPGIDPQR